MCSENEHDFKPQGKAYYKEFEPRIIGILGLPTYDQTVSFKMLYCAKCGETKEVISQDHRQTVEALNHRTTVAMISPSIPSR